MKSGGAPQSQVMVTVAGPCLPAKAEAGTVALKIPSAPSVIGPLAIVCAPCVSVKLAPPPAQLAGRVAVITRSRSADHTDWPVTPGISVGPTDTPARGRRAL